MKMDYLKVVISGEIIEEYRYEKHPSPPPKGIPRPGSRQRRVVERSASSIEVSRKGFLRLVRSNLGRNGSPTLLTLTVHSLLGIELGGKSFTLYMALLKQHFGKQLRYIGVPEFQERGAIHFHILVWGLPKEIIFHETPYDAWLKKAYSQPATVSRYLAWCESEGFNPADARGDRVLQNLWSLGYVDCVPTDGSLQLAGYLGKYMRKSMHDYRLRGRKAYYSSRNIMRPVSGSTHKGFEVQEMSPIFGDNELLFERDFDTLFLGRCNYKMFKRIDYAEENDSAPVGSQGV